jgi:hypothetical protein
VLTAHAEGFTYGARCFCARREIEGSETKAIPANPPRSGNQHNCLGRLPEPSSSNATAPRCRLAVLVVLRGLPATLVGNTGARFAARTAFGSDATMAATLRT